MTEQFRIRGCSGLGDQFYTYVVAKYYAAKGHDVLVETTFPEIFSTLKVKTTCQRIFDPSVYCTYVPYKTDRTTNQFQDVLRAAQIQEPLALECKLPAPEPRHKVSRHIQDVWGFQQKAKEGFPMCVVADLYKASGLRNKETLIPDKKIYGEIIERLSKKYFVVLTGLGMSPNFRCDCHLKGMTHIDDLMAVVAMADLVVTQVGALLPMSEALGTKVISILSANYRRSGDMFLNTITPKKVVCGKESFCFYDDTPLLIDRIEEII